MAGSLGGRPDSRWDGDHQQDYAAENARATPDHRSDAMRQAQDTILRRLGKALHLQLDAVTQEALPRRWVDLIQYLDERERKGSERQPQKM